MSGNYFTVVYRDISAGDEARTLGEHPKMSAMSWSHALQDRDAALAKMLPHTQVKPLPAHSADPSPADRMAELELHVERLSVLNAQLRSALTKANAQAEHFEREWYLRGDALEKASASKADPASPEDTSKAATSEISAFDFDKCEKSPNLKHSEEWYRNFNCTHCGTGEEGGLVMFIEVDGA